MAKITAAQKLINEAEAKGPIEFLVGAGSGNTLNTLQAIRRAGHEAKFISGEWQSKEGMIYRLTLKKATA